GGGQECTARRSSRSRPSRGSDGAHRAPARADRRAGAGDRRGPAPAPAETFARPRSVATLRMTLRNDRPWQLGAWAIACLFGCAPKVSGGAWLERDSHTQRHESRRAGSAVPSPGDQSKIDPAMIDEVDEATVLAWL